MKKLVIKRQYLIGKNDITKRTFKKYDAKELLKSTYTPIEYRFQYWFPDLKATQDFIEMQKLPNFGYYYQSNNKVAFYNQNGDVLYDDMDVKLQGMKKIHKGNVKTEMITEFILDEDVYIKLLPSLNLYKITSVQIDQHNKGKI